MSWSVTRAYIYSIPTMDELAKADVILLAALRARLMTFTIAPATVWRLPSSVPTVKIATVMGICGGYRMMGQEVLDLSMWRHRTPARTGTVAHQYPHVGEVTRQGGVRSVQSHSPFSTLHSPLMQG